MSYEADEEILQDFLIEAGEILESLSEQLVDLENDPDNFGYFDLLYATAQITGGNTTLTVNYYETTNDAAQGIGAIDTSILFQNIDTDGDGFGDTQTIYYSVLDATTGCSYAGNLAEIDLTVMDSPPLPDTPLVYNLCEDVGSADGYMVFDLNTYATDVLLAGFDPTLYAVHFYTALDASGNPDPTFFIANPGAYQNIQTPDQTIYVSVVSIVNIDSYGSGCEVIRPITLHVDLLPIANYTLFEVCDDDDDETDGDGFYTFDLTSEPYYSLFSIVKCLKLWSVVIYILLNRLYIK